MPSENLGQSSGCRFYIAISFQSAFLINWQLETHLKKLKKNTHLPNKEKWLDCFSPF